MRTKRVEWSYPTSTNAVSLGFSKDGCYSVELITGHEVPKVIAGFDTIEAARAHAETLPEPWDRLTK